MAQSTRQGKCRTVGTQSEIMKVSSQDKISANRRNGARSAGPRTSSGKAKSRLNALRHGLAAQQVVPTADVSALANAICGEHGYPVCLEPATRLAESLLTLRKIEEARLHIIEMGRLAASVTELANLLRYERRALSRQKRALHDFIEAQYLGASNELSRDKLIPSLMRSV